MKTLSNALATLLVLALFTLGPAFTVIGVAGAIESGVMPMVSSYYRQIVNSWEAQFHKLDPGYRAGGAVPHRAAVMVVRSSHR